MELICREYTAYNKEVCILPANREENEMSILEKNLLSNLKTINQIAKANTVKNKDGLTVISKDDPIRDEIDWETSVKKYEDKE
jgi:hypothetical protein